MNGVFPPELLPDESDGRIGLRGGICAGRVLLREGLEIADDGWSANIARLNQPCLRPPRWSDPQVRRMFCLPEAGLQRSMCAVWKGEIWLIRVRLQMNICRQCFREKSTDIGFNKVRYALPIHRPETRQWKDSIMSFPPILGFLADFANKI